MPVLTGFSKNSFFDENIAWIVLMAIFVICTFHLPFIHDLSRFSCGVLYIEGAFDALSLVSAESQLFHADHFL